MFLIKKIISQFFFPIPIIITLFIITFIFILKKRYKTGKILFIISLLFLIISSNYYFSNMLLKPLERIYPAYEYCPKDSTISYVVVLSAGAVNDDELPVFSKLGTTTSIRLIEGIRIAKLIPNSKLILSGGAQYSKVTSAHLMKDAAISIGFPESRIILESKSLDTHDEALYLKDTLSQKQFILVTSASHIYRSVKIFEKQGTNPIPAPVGHRAKTINHFSLNKIFPGTEHLGKTRTALYEILGIMYGNIIGIL